VAVDNAMNASVHLCCCEQLSHAGHFPEHRAYKQAAPASSMYAFGCLLFFVLTGRMPEQFASEKLRTSFVRDIGLTPKMSKLLQCLLDPVAENRPNASQVCLRNLASPARELSFVHRAGVDCIPSIGALHPATALVRMSSEIIFAAGVKNVMNMSVAAGTGNP
jgi:serine/threonine protein kinase